MPGTLKKSKNPSHPAGRLPSGPKQLALAGELSLEVEAAADGGADGLPTFSMVAYTGQVMRLRDWFYPVVLDLEGIKAPQQSRPVRLQHEAALGVGHTTSIQVANGKVIASGVISRATEAAREVVASSKNGFPWQASLGASMDEYEFIREKQTVQVNGKTYTGPLIVGRKCTVGEISIVDAGADSKTSVRIAAEAPPAEPADPATQDPEGDTPAAPATTPATVRAANDDDAVARIRASAAAEHLRIAGIERVTGQAADIRAQAIAEGWSVEKTELAVLRAERGRATPPRGQGAPATGALLECAALMAGGMGEAIGTLYEAQTIEASQRRFRHGLGMQEMLFEAARANGYDGHPRDTRQVLAFAFGNVQAAGFSTIDIGGILSNVANKFLLDGFMAVERTWRAITGIGSVRDFKTITSYRLIGADQYERVAPGGKIKHGTLGDESYTNKAETYGLMLQIDRRDIINDDLGAITTVPRKLGRGAGLMINDVFWTEFLDHASFFTSGNGNYIEGAATALGVDGLTAAEQKFVEQTDAEGKPIGLSPSILLVPPALNAMGSQLMKSMELRDTTASTKFPTANPHVGKFTLHMSRYIGNTAYTGASSKAYYLLANPQDLAVIETIFLNGQESPTIETADADFDVLGVRMRGYHDFGVAKQDARAAVKSKGEA
ncbi:MAG: hypothetical protein AMXMBFR77_26920 [Phycisphaerales bacterium]